MANDIALNANTLKEKITQRIMSSFTDLIPDEVFSSMVDETIKMFFEMPRAFTVTASSRNGMSDTVGLSTPLTTFQVMVWEQVRPLVVAKVNQYFEQEKNALTESLMESFAPDMKKPVAYNVSLLTHALANASQTQLVTQAMSMMQHSLWNMASRLNMPELATYPNMQDESSPVDQNTATVNPKY